MFVFRNDEIQPGCVLGSTRQALFSGFTYTRVFAEQFVPIFVYYLSVSHAAEILTQIIVVRCALFLGKKVTRIVFV